MLSPEPSAWLLLTTVIIGIAWVKRRSHLGLRAREAVFRAFLA